MKIVDSIIRMITGKKDLSLADVPEGMCPNCWGRNEYGGAFYESIKNEGIDVNSLESHVGWVQDYADKHLSGISLKAEDNEVVCTSCKLKFKKLS